MAQPLMPKATAVWLIDNTSLTFEQIADFCGLHIIEVQTLADSEVVGMAGMDPLASGQLSKEEIERCEKDQNARLELLPPVSADSILGKRAGKYTMLSKRQERPDAIAWVLKHYPLLSDSQICKLLATTKPTVQAVRSKTHWNSPNIKPKNPISMGLCTQEELDSVLLKAKKQETLPQD
ncbi:MAG TPA: cell cycle transcriptional regulator TrcR [Alphaproteobacteria bacterium]|nr:cell cycle transcriptional regulator TrcR [Alphaproteobacteria bacterium]